MRWPRYPIDGGEEAQCQYELIIGRGGSICWYPTLAKIARFNFD